MDRAGSNVDETLRLARQSAEQRIARYRVYLFVGASILSLIVRFIAIWRGTPTSSIPTVYFAIAALAAIVVRHLSTSFADRDAVVLASACFDVAVVFSLFPLMVLRVEKSFVIAFVLHAAVPTLIFLCLLNALRLHVRAAIVTSLFGIVAILVVLVPLEGAQPSQIPLLFVVALAGAISAAAAIQSRKNLEVFARLQLLRKYLSPVAVERVMSDRPERAVALGGEQLEVTLLSADLRGFTAMSERLAPSEVVRQLNEFHGAMLTVIERNGGMLDKFIGDGLLVVFGIGGEADHGASQALGCGRQMLDALCEHNRIREARNQTPLAIGIGIHSGSVVAGNIGGAGRIEFTVIGDAVNTASRLEGLTKEAGTPLLVSSSTVAHLFSREDLVELPPMNAKGKTASLSVFTVRSPAKM